MTTQGGKMKKPNTFIAQPDGSSGVWYVMKQTEKRKTIAVGGLTECKAWHEALRLASACGGDAQLTNDDGTFVTRNCYGWNNWQETTPIISYLLRPSDDMKTFQLGAKNADGSVDWEYEKFDTFNEAAEVAIDMASDINVPIEVIGRLYEADHVSEIDPGGSTQMRILAIDPGPALSAWVAYDPEITKIEAFGIGPTKDIIEDVCVRYRESPHATYLLAYEMVASYGMAVGREVFETCFNAGRIYQSFGGRAAMQCYRKQVVTYLCGSARAKDSNVRKALIDRFPATGKKTKGDPCPVGCKKHPGPLYGVSKDVWAALAVAVYAADNMPPK